MSIRTVEQISEWDSVPFAGGYDGLRSLADDEFSGAVVAGPTQLFMLNGTVVGVLDGDIEDFETADGTAREAPHDALALLAVMQERADEVRGQYYTQDTPIEDVDSTLSSGKFTGFVELSENVLSGDYFVVYHQGRSMSVAWVGSSQRLITDDEAFDQANDEVGIYDVKPVDISPVEIPEPEPEAAESTESAAGVGSVQEASSTSDDDVNGDSDSTTPGEDTVEATDASTTVADSGEQDSTDEVDSSTGERVSGGETTAGGPPGSKAAGASQGNAVRESERATEPSGSDSTAKRQQSRPGDEPVTRPDRSGTHDQQSAASQSEPVTDTTAATAETDVDTPTKPGQSQPDQSPDAGPSATAEASPATTPPSDSPPSSPGTQNSPQSTAPPAQSPTPPETGHTDDTAGSERTVADLETRSIPSLDPERSTAAAEQMSSDSDSRSDTDQSSQPTATPQPSRSRQESQQRPSGRSESQQSSQAPAQASASVSPQPTSSDTQQITKLEDQLADREDAIADLEAELDEMAATNESLRTERDELESKLADAQSEIDRLEEQLAEARGPAATASTQLSPGEAIGNTNLFVRYHSKGEATLDKVREGKATREEVEKNLRLEYHTQFEAGDAAVNGTPFEEFLHETLQYRFVDWLISDLLYEIGQTGHESSMQDLFDAIPKIDRAELDGKVSVEYTENGEQHRSQERFDVVVRDRMGNPLVVANINDARDPASEDQMTTLVRNGERVGNASETLAGAFLVTSSFFAPEALETAEEATSSGLLSRDKKKSYVNLSRKDGFHLCLLEARNQEFHLAVPEL